MAPDKNNPITAGAALSNDTNVEGGGPGAGGTPGPAYRDNIFGGMAARLALKRNGPPREGMVGDARRPVQTDLSKQNADVGNWFQHSWFVFLFTSGRRTC